MNIIAAYLCQMSEFESKIRRGGLSENKNNRCIVMRSSASLRFSTFHESVDKARSKAAFELESRPICLVSILGGDKR